jgi:hypothetical protein
MAKTIADLLKRLRGEASSIPGRRLLITSL